MKTKYQTIFTKLIRRSGSQALWEWLCDTDFFVAPASTQYHLAYEGGLAEHSWNVYENLVKINATLLNRRYSLETLAICALLHDVCKTNLYQKSTKNAKIDGKWTTVPCYIHRDSLPFGHGEKSVWLIEHYMQLTEEEAMAIRWHMGAWQVAQQDINALSAACEKYPLVLALQTADMMATKWDEVGK